MPLPRTFQFQYHFVSFSYDNIFDRTVGKFMSEAYAVIVYRTVPQVSGTLTKIMDRSLSRFTVPHIREPPV
jgi:hypothetical protein